MDLKEHYDFQDLLAIMQFLRSENGCPWDRAQDHTSLRENLIEESYETIDAINRANDTDLKEELGDVLLQVIFHAQIASERGGFTMQDVMDGLAKKLITRHSHLFGDDIATTDEAARATWEKNKRKEKHVSTLTENMKNVPASFPALKRSQKLQKRAADWNFDWDSKEPVWEKVQEELTELQEGIRNNDAANIEEEAGDVLFAFANYLRHLGVDAEIALNECSDKFIRRMEITEAMMKEDGIPAGPFDTPVAESYYQKARLQQKEEDHQV